MVTRPRARALRAAAGVALAALLAAACEVVAGIHDHDFVYAPDASSGEAGGADASGPTCAHASPPPSPGGMDDRDSEVTPLVFAMRTTEFSGAAPSGAVAGFDLDLSCTCDPTDDAHDAGPSCVPPKDAIRPGGCDDDAGIDNALHALDTKVGPSGLTDRFDDQVGESIVCGEQDLLVALSGYDGKANDPAVSVAILFSQGIIDDHLDGGGAPVPGCSTDPAGKKPARWDGEDLWSVPPQTVQRLGNGDVVPTVPYFVGYVRGFQIVVDARSDTTVQAVPIAFGDTPVVGSTPVITARLVPLDAEGSPLPIEGDRIVTKDGSGVAASFRLEDGIIAARATAKSLLAAVSTIRIASTGDGGTTYLCSAEAAGFYASLKSTICSGRDSVQDRTLDFLGSPCDSLSMALQFTAERAKIGSDYGPPPFDAGVCGPDFSTDCED